MTSSSSKVLLAAFVVCCVFANTYGSILCLWTGTDGKDQKVNCTNPDNKHCFSAAVTYNSKTFTVKGCSADTKYDAVVDASKSLKFGPNCTKDGDLGKADSGLFQFDLTCCSGKDYCNTGSSGDRVGVGFGLVTVVVASLVAKTVV